MPKTACPCCGRKLRIPDHLAGRRVSCPRCNEVVAVPVTPGSLQEAVEAAVSAETSSPADEPLPVPTRLGMTALAFGLASVPVLCVPLVGYASVVLSGVGLVVGLWGVFAALKSGPGSPGYSPAGGAGAGRRFGARATDYPLAGVAACLLALALALLPVLLR